MRRGATLAPVDAGMEKLRAYGNVTALDGMTPEELRDQIKNYDALIIRSASQASRLPRTAAAAAVAACSSLWNAVAARSPSSTAL